MDAVVTQRLCVGLAQIERGPVPRYTASDYYTRTKLMLNLVSAFSEPGLWLFPAGYLRVDTPASIFPVVESVRRGIASLGGRSPDVVFGIDSSTAWRNGKIVVGPRGYDFFVVHVSHSTTKVFQQVAISGDEDAQVANRLENPVGSGDRRMILPDGRDVFLLIAEEALCPSMHPSALGERPPAVFVAANQDFFLDGTTRRNIWIDAVHRLRSAKPSPVVVVAEHINAGKRLPHSWPRTRGSKTEVSFEGVLASVTFEQL